MQQVEDRHAGGEPECVLLREGGHAGRGEVVQSCHRVALVFEDAVDAVRVRDLRFEQAGALGDRPGDVGGDPVDGVVIGPEHVLPAQHRRRVPSTWSCSATSWGGWVRSIDSTSKRPCLPARSHSIRNGDRPLSRYFGEYRSLPSRMSGAGCRT